MKTMLMLFSILLLILVLVGADFRKDVAPAPAVVVVKKKCVGYTIIEFGKGIDCNGDTVRLQKIQGGQVLASRLQHDALQAVN
jgi:hypothetical protein